MGAGSPSGMGTCKQQSAQTRRPASWPGGGPGSLTDAPPGARAGRQTPPLLHSQEGGLPGLTAAKHRDPAAAGGLGPKAQQGGRRGSPTLGPGTRTGRSRRPAGGWALHTGSSQDRSAAPWAGRRRRAPRQRGAADRRQEAAGASLLAPGRPSRGSGSGGWALRAAPGAGPTGGGPSAHQTQRGLWLARKGVRGQRRPSRCGCRRPRPGAGSGLASGPGRRVGPRSGVGQSPRAEASSSGS